MAALGSQSIASSYEQLLHVDRDGGGNTTTHVSIKDGDNGTTFGFTIASDALMMTSTNRLEFGDTGTYIHQSADGVLDLVSDTEIELTATTIDLNGAVAMDGAITGGTNITISGELDAATLDISGDADIDGTLEADAITVNGTALATFIRDTVGTNMLSSNSESGITVTYDTTNDNIDFAVDAAQTGITSLLAADIKIGEDDETKIDFETANEIHLYANNTEQVYVADNIFGPNADSDVDLGATGVRWKDAFVDSITVTGEIDGASLDIEGNADINGTTNLDAVDIDGAVQIDNTVTVGADDQGYDVIFYGDAASSNMTWDTSEDDLILNDATLKIDQDDNVQAIYIDSESTTTNVIQIDAPTTTTANCLAIESANGLTTGSVARFTSNSSTTDTRDLVRIVNDHTSATGATALKVQQDAAQTGLLIDQNGNGDAIAIDFEGTSGNCIEVQAPTSTTGTCILIQNANALTTGGIAEFHSNSADTGTRDIVKIQNDHASATGATALKIAQDAAQYGMFIDQNGNANAIFIDSETTSNSAFRVDADALTTGPVAFIYSNSSDTGARNILDVRNDHTSADNAVPLYIKQDGNNKSVQIESHDASLTNEVMLLNAVGRSSSDAFSFIKTFTDGDNDVQHFMRGDGAFLADGSYSDGGADYAEYFESKDGKAIAVGKTVKLDGDKVVACEDGDNPMGVVRPYGNSVVIGNAAPLKWTGKYLKDDYGAYIMEEYSVTEWMEDTDEVKHQAVEAKDAVLYAEGDEIPEGKKVGDVKEAAIEAEAVVYMHKDIQYQTDKIPSDVSVPSDATVTSTEKDGTKLTRKKKNPDYDESKTYAPREERDEWCLIGLLGQIPITKGQPVADNWIKMKDVSNSVEMYFVK